MSANNPNVRPIIIKKKKASPHGAHGGSWKIAYADFVTAMMAFFMLMWLINVTSEEQRKGIADYFAPTLINQNLQNGGGGLMGGVNVSNPNNSNGKGKNPSPTDRPEDVTTQDTTSNKMYDQEQHIRKSENTIKSGQNEPNPSDPQQEKTVEKNKGETSPKESGNKERKNKNKAISMENAQQQEKASKEDIKTGTSSAKGQELASATAKSEIARQGQTQPARLVNNQMNNVGTHSKDGRDAIQGYSLNQAHKQGSARAANLVNSNNISEGFDKNQGKENVQGRYLSRMDVPEKEQPAHQSQKKALSKNQDEKTVDEKDITDKASKDTAKNASTANMHNAQTTNNTSSKEAILARQLLQEAIEHERKRVEKRAKSMNYQRTLQLALSSKSQEQNQKISQKRKEALKSEASQKALKDLQEAETKQMKDTANQLQALIAQNPDLKGLLPHLVIEIRPEGLRIQLVDRENLSMFPSGSSVVLPSTKKLLSMIARLIAPLSNQLVISGHTDARPFVNTKNYSNWELSADRANATRRVLQEENVSGDRFESVMGKESTEPFLPENPSAPQNRRISITLLRQFGVPDSAAFTELTGGQAKS